MISLTKTKNCFNMRQTHFSLIQLVFHLILLITLHYQRKTISVYSNIAGTRYSVRFRGVLPAQMHAKFVLGR